MGYKGIAVPLPCGQGGFNSSQNVYQIDISDLTRANNIRYDGYTWTKAGGLAVVDANAIANTPTCVGGISYRPTVATQRIISAWTDGNIYREVSGNVDANTLSTGATFTAPVAFVEGGQISNTENKKLFAFSSAFSPKYIDGDATSFTNIATVSTDWSSVYPGACLYHDSRLIAYDHATYPHSIYISALHDHAEYRIIDANNFSTGARTFDITPGAGDRISCLYSLMPEVLYAFKYPYGIYKVDTADYTGYGLPVETVRADVGMAGPYGISKVGNDIWFISSTGRIYSLLALDANQDPTDADITRRLKLTDFIRENVDLTRLRWSRLIYNEERKELWYVYTSNDGDTNDQALVFDLNDESKPKVSVERRGEYFNAMWSRINPTTSQAELLCAGADTGKIYTADSSNYVIDTNVAYTGEFWYPETDFGFVDTRLAQRAKRFDSLEIYIVPTGDYDMTFEIYIDGRSYKTETINLGSSSDVFDSAIFDSAVFGGQNALPRKLTINGIGQQISIKGYNGGENENFKISKMILNLTPLGDDYET